MSAWQDLLDGLEPLHQLPAVHERRSAVVSAGAGSGKTRVLAVRYLHLVKERGIAPERILCLTFTKKAAAEMSERIRGMLASCARDDDDFRRALEAFPAARVSTLDSFCADIARNGCARWGVAPDFVIDEVEATSALEALSVDYLLRKRFEPVAASFIAATGFENAAAALLGLSGGRSGLLVQGRRFDAPAQTKAVADVLAAAHERLHGLLSGGLGLDGGSGATVAAWLERSSRFSPLAPAPDDSAALEVARADYLAVSGLRRPGTNTKGAAAAYYNEAGVEAKALAAAAVLGCDALLDDRRQGAMDLLGDFVAEAAEARAASGKLAFADVAAMAVETLAGDLDLRDWYRSRFDAVMVDEFQDDNELQKRLLYLVAERRDRTGAGRGPTVGPEDLEPGVLFFVGDEKQSVYAFRGADVTVFRGLSKELALAPGGFGEHRLEVNWRSEPGLIDFFNATFSRILPAPDDEAAQDFEARFTRLGSGPATPGVEPVVAWLESNEPGDDGWLPSGEAEAWRIAELVKSLVRDGAIIAAKGPGGRKTARACGYDDIAVLFKSTVSQNVVERYFRLFGIPYTASSTAGLYAESVLGDLYAMLRLVVYPDDRLAFASVLRGPFARLSDDSVFAVLSPGSAGPDGLLGFDPAALAPDEAARFAAARATWQGLRERADREPLRRLVEYLWYDRGLRWSVQKDPSQAAFLEHFDYAWTMAAAADSRGERLVDLVASLEARMGKLERYDEGPVARESSRGVSIMTVHLSKGLEFPVVILPDLDNIGRNTPSEPIARDGRFGPSIRLLDPASTPRDPVDAFDRALRKIEKGEGEDAMNESLAETARLCYVACTRAISRLYLVGKVPRNADKSGRSFRGLLLRAWPWAGPASASDEEFLSDRPDDAPASFSVAYVEPRTQADWYTLVSGSRCDGRQLAAATAAAASTAVAERKSRWSVTGAAARLEELACLESIASQPAGETGEAQPAGAEGLSDVDFGTLCHQILESVLGRPDEEPKPRGAVAAALERLPAQARKASLQSALDLARTFALSPRGIAAAAARDAARAGVPNAVFRLEYPFVWRGQARPGQPLLLSGAMDLVYGNGEGMVVIDFKTDRVINPARHAFQLSVYRDAAESIFGLPAKAYVSYLRDGSEQEVSGLPDITDLDGHCA